MKRCDEYQANFIVVMCLLTIDFLVMIITKLRQN